MTVKEYITLSGITDLSFFELTVLSEPGNKYRSIFDTNSKSIVDDFFENLTTGLIQKMYSELRSHLPLLMISAFEPDLHGEKFLQALRIINNYTDSDYSTELLDYLWVILDHVYHEQTYELVYKDFIKEVTILRQRLPKLNHCSDDSIDLLDQKIGHIIP